MMISHITKTATAMSALALMSSAAYAGCGNALYCNSGSQGHVAASTSGYGSTVTLPGTYGYGSSTVTLPGTYGSSYSSTVTLPGTYGSMSDSQADAAYGSGSISGAYVDSSSVGSAYTSSHVSSLSIPGLGASERLCPTACNDGINVHGANGKRVLACYKVCQPVQVQNYIRVVRPIVYVRYPVPVPVATCAAPVNTWGARYLGHGTGCGW